VFMASALRLVERLRARRADAGFESAIQTA